MAAVAPGTLIIEGPDRIIVGTNWLPATKIRCPFLNVNTTTPDTWDTRQVTAGTNQANGILLKKVAWEPTASADDAAVTFSTTAATAAQSAFSTVSFDGAEADADGNLYIWF